jgi:hypothetical protein
MHHEDAGHITPRCQTRTNGIIDMHGAYVQA